MTARETRLLWALRSIECVPQAYHSRGPDFCRDEMRRRATDAIQAEKAREDAAAYRKARRESETQP